MVVNGGLVPPSEQGGATPTMHVMGGPASPAAPSVTGGSEQPNSADSESLAASAESHLDTFFEGSMWTRDDVLVIAAVAQLLLLMYLAVRGDA